MKPAGPDCFSTCDQLAQNGLQKGPYLWYGYIIRIYGKLFLGPEFQVTLLPSVRSSPCGNKGLGCGLQARKNSYCLNSVDLLKLSRVLMRLRRNAKSCYSCRPSHQGQLWELVAKLCYREDKRYIWLGLKKKKKKVMVHSGLQCVGLILPGLGVAWEPGSAV